MTFSDSMEEASALANKVGIMAKQMLGMFSAVNAMMRLTVGIIAVGTPDSLSARYPLYEVHFSCHTREDVSRAQQLLARIPGSRMADDVATRFEVPVQAENCLSLAQLFHILSSQGDFPEYTVERGTLESVFLKVIRENNVLEEDNPRTRERRCRCW
jgi:ATP-binding cassette, subfamily A (ABC1), member 3